MHESSPSYATPHPPGTPSPGETRDRIDFQADHPEVGFSPLPLCENPDERWVAYWWAAEEGRARRVTGSSLGDVIDSLADEFGWHRRAEAP